jgi:hypothetical protein
MQKWFWKVGPALFSILFFLMIMTMIAGCTSVHMCANPATDSTLFQLGVSNTTDYSCNEGLDDDLLDPDIYTTRDAKNGV